MTHLQFQSPEPRRLDPRIWRACAGNSIQVPVLHSRVYYFPQGHAEQSSSTPLFKVTKPAVLCRISAVDLLADRITDEVFVKLRLVPLAEQQFGFAEDDRDDSSVVCDEGDDKISVFAKVLTPSDANNGGGFSVPRSCADLIFPPLNFQADPPVQTLGIFDVHGVYWEFRHIYRGTPRRHLLTTGWSKFVNSKKLIAGDSVVFMRNSQGSLFVGVRRAARFQMPDSATWRAQIEGDGGCEVRMNVEEEVFSRSDSGRIPPEMVVQAAELAVRGSPFEVFYYPKMGGSDFVVKAEAVENAMNAYWSPGMRVKMAVETDDSSKMTWYQGTVAAALMQESGPWSASPWRMLQVTWDESEALQNFKLLNPWEVEIIPATPLHLAFPYSKKLRLAENSGFLTEGEGEIVFPMSGLPDSTMTSFDASLLNYNTSPAGMQGARQNNFSFVNFFNSSQNVPLMVPKVNNSVSAELNIGSSQSENLSPDSQSSIPSFGKERILSKDFNTAKAGITSFQLFGKVIHTNQPDACGFDDVESSEDDGDKRREASTVETSSL